MSILDVLAHALNEHHTRAQREGRALEANFVALIKEIVMSTVQDLQGKISNQSDKISQLEADVRDLVGRAGGTAPAADSSGIRLNQDQLDSMVNAVDSNNSRIDALKEHVVTGQGKGPESKQSPLNLPQTPSTSTPDTPVIPSSAGSLSEPSAAGGVTSGNADTPQSTAPVTPPNNPAEPNKSNG
jgi:hypothetical protein